MSTGWIGFCIVIAAIFMSRSVVRLSDTTFVVVGIGVEVCDVTAKACTKLERK